MMKANHINRRQFLKRTAAVGAAAVGFPYVVRASALGKGGAVAPSNRIVMAAIGVGGMGTSDMKAFMSYPDVQMVAVCDVYEKQRKQAKTVVDDYYGNTACTTYNDFRELCARPDIDACTIATPNQWHVPLALEAVRNRKDVYLEKPMSLSVNEDIMLRREVHRHQRVFQFGTQQRSSYEFRFVCELVRNGRIGKLQRIVVSSPASGVIPNQPTQPVPEGLDYDMWLGPAPWTPYSFHRCRPYIPSIGQSWWYWISDYSLGFISGWGVHHVDIAQWGNGTDRTGPVEIAGTGTFPKDGMTDTATRWDVELTYGNGVKMLFQDLYTSVTRFAQFQPFYPGQPRHDHGVLFEGTEGWAVVSRGYMDTEPKSLLKSVIGPDEIRLYDSKEHHRNLLDCIKTRSETICPIDVASRSDIVCQISDIAIRLGRKLRWDPDKERFVNDQEANRYLSRPMRSPWHL